MGPGARPLFRARLGHDVRAAARDARSSAESAAGAKRRPARGPGWPRHLRVHGLEFFPATAGGGAWSLSLVRKPVGIEAAECSVTSWQSEFWFSPDVHTITARRWSSTVPTAAISCP